MPEFTPEQKELLASLDSPEKIQDFIDSLAYNFCGHGYPKPYECKSPKRVLEERNAHCFEGALFAAAALRVNGETPFIIELNGVDDDVHMIAPFRRKGLWGSLAQSQYYTLKWRDPIHRSPRELALSYFPVYSCGEKITLRTYTSPINLSRYNYLEWMTTDKCLERLGEILGKARAHPLFPGQTSIRNVPTALDELTRQHIFVKTPE